MRLIDADKLKAAGYALYRTYQKDAHTMVSETIRIDTIPTIDAAPVVRCRECQKWKKTFELDNGQVFGACDRFYGAVTEDSFFCRDGQ